MNADLPGLDQLRELPLPPPVSYWPQTWGWAGLALVIVAVAIYALAAWVRCHRRNLYRRQALAELARLRVAAADQPLAARQLPDLLKRTALAAQCPGMAQPAEPLLATLAYAPDAAVRELDAATLDQLFDASRRWIERHQAERHHVAA